MDYIFFVIGLIIGSTGTFLYLKGKYASQISSLKERSAILDENNQRLDAEIRTIRDENTKLQSRLSSNLTEIKNLQQKLSEEKAEIEELNKRLSKEFENLANKIFSQNSTRLSELNKEKISSVLNPLGEKIKAFESRVNEIYSSDTRDRAALKEQIKMLSDLNQQMSKDADNLTKALKGETKTQGTWGEFILETILEKSGLVKGEQYKIQESITQEDGRRLQPDVVVYLPENKTLIIDSKVSLTAYERFTSSDEDEERKNFLKQHIDSIRNHIKSLSEKNYQNISKLNSHDFVLMFLPIEPAFALAVQNEENIFNYAFERNIVIVSPSTLFAVLRTIESIWRQEKQSKYAQEIAVLSGRLYDKFVNFLSDLDQVGQRLEQAQRSFESAKRKISDGQGNMISTAEKIRELGAKNSKTLPDNYTDKALDE
ncbi:MAG: DNA recombination protein RmuC [Melioribacteraceae bacterium]|nr:DNA recombination protein RmuC [Melioribacteraceae bacterium]MCO6473909.1 DNA recombination protein RmuC [Melioribacteraceae bacterium]MDD3558310.1 DNA recombination protein RmuC [Melioribacteraceae bacterium]